MHPSALCSGRDDPALPPSFTLVRHRRWQANLSDRGFGLLDLLITLLVLALVLLAAVKQFSVYARKLAAQPAPQEQSTGAQPPAPSQ